MTMAFLSTLSHSEGGRRFLLNLFDGAVAQRHLPIPLVKGMVRTLERLPAPAPGRRWHPYLAALESCVFADPDLYQYRGPAPAAPPGYWMTVKTGADLGELILQSPWTDSDAMRRRFSPFALDALDPGLADGDYEVFAAIVNDQAPPIRFRLAKVVGRKSRPTPVWMSRWCEFQRRHPRMTYPSAAAAGRIRDWLGLPHEGVPLFVIRARSPGESARYLGRRPTIMDGISNPLFKHRVTTSHSHGCGTTADISLLRRRPRRPDTIDGGPEIVARRFWFHPRHHECIYVGRAPPLSYNPRGEFHRRLLGDRDFASILRDVENALA